MKIRLVAALMLGVATVTLGPVACNMAGTDTAVSTADLVESAAAQ